VESEWEKLVKRYVWNDERTPYFTRVVNLSQRQAHYELFGYALLVGVVGVVLSVASLSTELPHADAGGVSLYAFTVCCAAVLLGATRHPWAALWCASAPLALLAYFAVWGFHPALETVEKSLLVAIVVAWLLYSPRAVAVARAWESLAGPG
jgi:hypothetical protein